MLQNSNAHLKKCQLIAYLSGHIEFEELLTLPWKLMTLMLLIDKMSFGKLTQILKTTARNYYCKTNFIFDAKENMLLYSNLYAKHLLGPLSICLVRQIVIFGMSLEMI